MKYTIAFTFFHIFVSAAYAQQKLPLLKASSVKVAIKDGEEGKTRYWNHLEKSKFPIVYDLAKNQKSRKVTFYTDIDSISFTAEPSSIYPFRVVLNQKDTISVLLTTNTTSYTKLNNLNNEIDTFPFSVNKNKQIILKGSINNSPEIDFVFDLGARITYLIGKDIAIKNKLLLDGHMEDESVTGMSIEKTSSKNILKFGNIIVENTPICYIDEPGFLDNGGGLIGFNIFQSKILEIDFDMQLIIVQNELPAKKSEYATIPFKQTTGGMYIPITINNGVKESTGWYFFDTGADNALSIDSKFAKRESLNSTLKVIGKTGIASSESSVINALILEVPELKIANFRLTNVPTLFADESNAEADFEDGVIGIALQKRFNFIIDYPNGIMYLKPNKYYKDSFKKKDNTVTYILAILILTIVMLTFYFYKRKKI